VKRLMRLVPSMTSSLSGSSLKTLLLASALMTAACGEQANEPVDTTLPEAASKPPQKLKSQAEAPKKLASCVGASCRVITGTGWAGIEAGMTVAQAMAASGLQLEYPGRYDEAFADEPARLESCNIHEIRGVGEAVSVFVEDGIVTSLGFGGKGSGSFQTDRGIRIGDSEAKVRKAYKKLREEPDIYSEPPDKKLFHEVGGRGLKFSIVGGKVEAINAGGSSIQYVEGCL